MADLLEMMLSADEAIFRWVDTYGLWIYVILFSIIFIETGLVIVSFFPGDTLLFSAGMLSATGDLSLLVVIPMLVLATVLGHTSNYFIGRFVGSSFFEKHGIQLRQYLKRADTYYQRYGGQAVIWSRFVPFMRAFVPFVSGIARMEFGLFTRCNVIGGIIWILVFTLLGFFFGQVPWVKENYGLIFSLTLLIMLVSILVSLVGTVLKRPTQAK